MASWRTPLFLRPWLAAGAVEALTAGAIAHLDAVAVRRGASARAYEARAGEVTARRAARLCTERATGRDTSCRRVACARVGRCDVGAGRAGTAPVTCRIGSVRRRARTSAHKEYREESAPELLIEAKRVRMEHGNAYGNNSKRIRQQGTFAGIPLNPTLWLASQRKRFGPLGASKTAVHRLALSD